MDIVASAEKECLDESLGDIQRAKRDCQDALSVGKYKGIIERESVGLTETLTEIR